MTYPFAPTAQEWAARLGNLKRTGNGAFNGPCPLCGGRDRFHVKEGQGRALVGCRGCLDGQHDPSRFGELMRAVWGDDPRPSPQRTNLPDNPVPERGSTVSYARKLWARSQPVPSDPLHPARLWLLGTAGHGPLWRPDVPLPSAVRWLPSGRRDGGSLVAAIAPWAAWRLAWPALPTVDAVQLVFIGGDGLPAKDRDGLGKRSYGKLAGGACLIGNPGPDERVGIAEGVADALAVAARFPCTVAGVMGTAGFRSPETAEALLDAFQVEIWGDQDGPGAAAAAALGEALAVRGVPVTARIVTRGKDPAAAGGQFPYVDDALLTAEVRRAVLADAIPEDEAKRQVSALLMEAVALAAADAGVQA